MKQANILLVISLLFILSCSSSITHEYYQEVGYIQTHITNVNDQYVSFANGMGVKTNRIIIAVNSTPVLLVIENYTGSGYFYLRNNKVNFSINQSAADLDLLGVQRGRLHYLHDFNEDNRTITLVDSTQWFIPVEEQWKQVKNWKSNPELLIPDNKPPKGEFFIHTPTSQSVLGINVEDITQ